MPRRIVLIEFRGTQEAEAHLIVPVELWTVHTPEPDFDSQDPLGAPVTLNGI
jgi:hypothetical protein